MAVPLKQHLLQWTKKTRKSVRVATGTAVKVAVMANAVMAVVVDAMVAAVNAAKVPKAKFVPLAKATAAAKAAVKPARTAVTNCVMAKPAQHAQSVPNVVSAQSVPPVNVRRAKVVAMVAVRAVVMAATKAEMKAEMMPCRS